VHVERVAGDERVERGLQLVEPPRASGRRRALVGETVAHRLAREIDVLRAPHLEVLDLAAAAVRAAARAGLARPAGAVVVAREGLGRRELAGVGARTAAVGDRIRAAVAIAPSAVPVDAPAVGHVAGHRSVTRHEQEDTRRSPHALTVAPERRRVD
jgi:hypothetical protein